MTKINLNILLNFKEKVDHIFIPPKIVNNTLKQTTIPQHMN